MPKAFPPEFRRDVVAVARKGEAPLSQIAKDFGISESCLHRWLKIADVEDGHPSRVTAAESAELRELRKRNRRPGAGERDPAPGGGVLRSGDLPKMMYPLVLDLAADGIPVAVTCRVLGFSKQAFYAWRRNPVTASRLDDAHLINAALDIHHDDPAFGYRFIADELPARGVTAGREPGRPAVLPAADLVGVRQEARADTASPARRCMTTWSSGSSPPSRPNQLWLTDITEHRTAEGKLYLCAIKDVYSEPDRRLLHRLTHEGVLAVSALRNAIALRGHPAGTVVHSDRGSQFRSKAFVRTLANNGLVGSMGRVGACGDNAAMESFFALLQRNVLDRQTLDHPRRTAPGDRRLDRTDLPPQAPATRPRPAHPHRI